MFQIHVRSLDYEQSRKLYNNIDFELGEWLHIGWSYYNEVSTGYKDGCLYKMVSNWQDHPYTYSINAGVLFGSQSDIDIDILLDEVYFWDARKPGCVFSALYSKSL